MAALAVICLAGMVVAGLALGNAVIYKNGFARRGDVKEMKGAGGKHCDKSWRRKAKTLEVTVTRGPEACGYRPPVVGDEVQPNHDLSASMKIRRDTPKSLRDNAYVALDVRSSRKSGYELRIFPKAGKWRLLRDPSGGGFPDSGKDHRIKGIDHRNVVELHAKGGDVKAYVNGHRITKVSDSNPEDLRGRKVEVIVGSTGHSKKDTVATVDDVKLAVP